ncbi:TonB-dependent receptor domain-containing protein [Nostoc sp.]
MRVNLLFAVSSLLITLSSVTVADLADAEQPLSEKPNASSDEVKSEIHSVSEVQAYKTSATYLLRTPRNHNFVHQLSQVTSDVVSVTDVKVNNTDKGIELILITPNSVELQVSGKTEGNSYIVDIPNARLQLASGESFRQEKPAAGIALVTVANVDASTLQVTVVGEANAPQVELFDSQIEGLVFGVTATISTAQQPTTTPDQTREILPGWNVITAYSYTDARITQDNNFPVGNLLPNQPVHLASLWTTYIIPKGNLQGLGFGFGLTYVGDQQVDSFNTLKLPSYIRADAALYYRRNNFNAALNIQNLFDKRYFEASNGDTQVYPALPLTAKFTLGWQF